MYCAAAPTQRFQSTGDAFSLRRAMASAPRATLINSPPIPRVLAVVIFLGLIELRQQFRHPVRDGLAQRMRMQ
jgi:hypothetical protein